VISLAANPAHTAASQWLERTLDDSANRRLALPRPSYRRTPSCGSPTTWPRASGLPAVVRRNLDAELPFLASEVILMAAVQRGGDRQERTRGCGPLPRRHERMLLEGEDNDFLERVAADRRSTRPAQLASLLDPPPLRRPGAAAGSRVLAEQVARCSRARDGPRRWSLDLGCCLRGLLMEVWSEADLDPLFPRLRARSRVPLLLEGAFFRATGAPTVSRRR